MNVAITKARDENETLQTKSKPIEAGSGITVLDKLILDSDILFSGDVHVRGSINSPEGALLHNLTVKGNLTVDGDVKLYDLNVSGDIFVRWDLDAMKITTQGDINAYRVICETLEQPGNRKIVAVSFIDHRSKPEYKVIFRGSEE